MVIDAVSKWNQSGAWQTPPKTARDHSEICLYVLLPECRLVDWVANSRNNVIVFVFHQCFVEEVPFYLKLRSVKLNIALKDSILELLYFTLFPKKRQIRPVNDLKVWVKERVLALHLFVHDEKD